MDDGPYEDLPRAQQRRLVLRAALRSLATAAGLFALYYLLPADHWSDASALGRLLLGAVVLVGILAWQIRAIIRSDHPRVRAIEALFVAIPFLVVTFASTYFLISRSSDASFGETLSRTDVLYFTVTVFATVGFGDISAKSEPARLVVTAQMVADLILIGVGVRLLTGATRIGLHRRSEAGDASRGDPTG